MDKLLLLTVGPIIAVNGFFFILLGYFALVVYPRLDKSKVSIVENRHHSKILNKWFRHYWIWLSTPVCQGFVKLGMTPNSISLLGTIMGVIAAAGFAFGYPIMGLGAFGFGGWMMIFGASLDFMDGWVARATNQTSLSGAFYDSVMDRISEGALFTGLAYYFRHDWHFWLVMAGYLGAMMTSYAKCRGDKMGASYEGGTMQRPERIVYIGVGAVFAPLIAVLLNRFFPQTFPDATQTTHLIYSFPLGFVAIMANWTTVDRIRNVMRLLDEQEGKKR